MEEKLLCADMHYKCICVYKRLEAFILIIKYQICANFKVIYISIFFKSEKKLIRHSFFIMIATIFVSRAVTDKLRRTIGK